MICRDADDVESSSRVMPGRRRGRHNAFFFFPTTNVQHETSITHKHPKKVVENQGKTQNRRSVHDYLCFVSVCFWLSVSIVRIENAEIRRVSVNQAVFDRKYFLHGSCPPETKARLSVDASYEHGLFTRSLGESNLERKSDEYKTIQRKNTEHAHCYRFVQRFMHNVVLQLFRSFVILSFPLLFPSFFPPQIFVCHEWFGFHGARFQLRFLKRMHQYDPDTYVR